MDKRTIELIAIDWVCPNNHNPTTPYEKGEVEKLVRFAEDVILALGLPKDKPPSLEGCEDRPDCWRLRRQRELDVKHYEGE